MWVLGFRAQSLEGGAERAVPISSCDLLPKKSDCANSSKSDWVPRHRELGIPSRVEDVILNPKPKPRILWKS